MRPFRFLLSLATCIIAFFILLYVGPWKNSADGTLKEQSSIGAYFNWRAPSSLFPPSAVISLTDDNQTFFLARPAAFGPLLPVKSLSGQLWIGSGFGDDGFGRNPGAEGELGCSDMPGWSDGPWMSGGKSLTDAKASWSSSQDSASRSRRKRDLTQDEKRDESEQDVISDDGTDDYLHHPLPASNGLKSTGEAAGSGKKSAHADIQSLQEGAEIAGKIVLLSRGGCGFLEKVKWAQRRGGVALIVGDDIRGGPLVTMYARGDTSNVTIPSLFTSRMTAHLLSTLIPSGGIIEGANADRAGRLGLAAGGKADSSKDGERKETADKSSHTTNTAAVKSTPTAKTPSKGQSDATSPSDKDLDSDEPNGWFGSLFAGKGNKGENYRPPTSGTIGWRLQDEFEDEDDVEAKKIRKQHTTTTTSPSAAVKTQAVELGDGFVIGVQDWRDPDLVAQQKEQLLASASVPATAAVPTSSRLGYASIPKGGSITPGSGEYAKSGSQKSDDKDSALRKANASPGGSGRWFGGLFGNSDAKDAAETVSRKSVEGSSSNTQPQSAQHSAKSVDATDIREGLWITLTPQSMSSSPFFDTLLVLVVSPLVTLTVVYALLLLRSRIRRRRWRAPKSVVERLPVRTYQTMANTTTSTSAVSSASSHLSASTPLLPSSARTIDARPRPRSRTASDVPVQQSSSLRSENSVAPPSLEQIEEKRAAGLAEWKKQYGGKQRECVVCLEEYVDGVSRVMSLPCGHEFHAECITPWLTTRRRTCPICKGDVVRSLARSSGSGSNSAPLIDEEDSDDVQEEAAMTRNDDPAAAQPVSREDEAFEDLEQGMGHDRTR